MSLSFHRRDRDGNVHRYFIPFAPLATVALFAVSVGIAFSAWLAFRELVLQSPVAVATGIAFALAVGFASFGAAKLSVIRNGTIVSFGPKLMTARMRQCYFFGYATMGCACLLAGLFALVA